MAVGWAAALTLGPPPCILLCPHQRHLGHLGHGAGGGLVALKECWWAGLRPGAALGRGPSPRFPTLLVRPQARRLAGA